MSNSHVRLVERFLTVYNGGDWDRLDALVSDDYVHHNCEEALTLAGFKAGAAWIRNGIPDLRVWFEDLVCENDRVATRFVGKGTHLGSLTDEEPTSRSVVLHGMTIYRIQHDVIAEDWEAMDERQLLKQVGLA